MRNEAARLPDAELLRLLQKRLGAPDREPVTVAACWEVYWQQHVVPNLIGKDLVRYSWRNLAPFFAALAIEEVNQRVVDRFAKARREGLGGMRQARPATIRRELAYLRAAFNFSAGPHSCLLPPSMVPLFELPKGSRPRQRWLTREEFQRLVNAAAGMRRDERLSKLEIFMWLAIETAGRRQALLDLEWARVDFEVGIVHLDVPGREQTNKRRASVPMSAALRVVLERAFAERRNDLVLGNSNAGLWRSFQVAAIHAGFSDQEIRRGQKPKATGISPHVLRHTAATWMARRGVSFFIVGQVLGVTAQTAEKHYAKWAPIPAVSSTDHITAGLVELPPVGTALPHRRRSAAPAILDDAHPTTAGKAANTIEPIANTSNRPKPVIATTTPAKST